jgi:hypothetical protein
MAIIRNIVNQAFQLPGIIAADEVAEGTDTALAVIKLNELLAQLNTDALFPFSRKIVTYTIGASKDHYSIGIDNTVGATPADIVEERPIFINRILAYPSATAMPINVQQLDINDLLTRQLSADSSGLPAYFAVNPLYPYADIYFDVKPSARYVFKIIYNASIPEVTINSTLHIPPEYNDVLVTGLARQLCVLKQVDEGNISLVSALYKEAIDRITSANERNQLPILDSLYGGNRGTIYSYSPWSSGGY